MGPDPFEGGTPVSCAGVDPEHIVWFEEMDPATSDGLTVMVTAFDVAGFPVMQVSFDVSTQVMMSPFSG
jgi:hypothetical protein